MLSPIRFGYPVYMNNNLSTIYERAGRIEGINGSSNTYFNNVGDDIIYPIPYLTGYIT